MKAQDARAHIHSTIAMPCYRTSCTRRKQPVHTNTTLVLVPVYKYAVYAPVSVGAFLQATAMQQTSFAPRGPAPVIFPWSCEHATHTRGAAVLAGDDARYADRQNTGQTFHNQMCQFASGGKRLELESFNESCEKAVEIMNEAAAAHWEKMFMLRVVAQPQHNEKLLTVFLQVACLPCQVGDFIEGFLNPHECIVAQLAVQVKDLGNHHFSVFNGNVDVVYCLQNMKMRMLLNSCALLCAQQFAYLGTKEQSVCIKSDDFPGELAPCCDTTPQAVKKVAMLLWTWYETSGCMYVTPPWQQFRRKRCLQPRQGDLLEDINSIAKSMHRDMCEAVRRLNTTVKIEQNDIAYFNDALESAIKIMHGHLDQKWRELFQVTMTRVQGCFYLLKISCVGRASLDFGSDNHVVAKLQLEVRKPTAEDFTRAKAQSSFYVELEYLATAICFRQLRLGTLLCACALLATQQFAYFGTETQTVALQGEAVSDGSQLIFGNMFREIMVEPDVKSLVATHRAIVDSNQKHVPQSIQNVASMLMYSLHSCAQMHDAFVLP